MARMEKDRVGGGSSGTNVVIAQSKRHRAQRGSRWGEEECWGLPGRKKGWADGQSLPCGEEKVPWVLLRGAGPGTQLIATWGTNTAQQVCPRAAVSLCCPFC